MLNYNPKDAVMLWTAGEYDAELVKVEQTTSKKSGNPMEVWTSKVFAPDGQEQLIDDYVVVPAATFKIKQLAIALNKKDAFEGGVFQAEDFIGSGYKVELVVEKSDQFDDKNKIKKYKPSSAAPSPSQSRRPQSAAVGAPFGDEATVPPEDIPFAWEPLTRWV